MSEYLVTGAAGFIGAAVARRLLGEGHAVTTIDNLSTGAESNLPSGCRFIEGDASDPATIRRLEDRRFDSILHLAGQSGGIPSFRDPVHDLQSNTTSTLRLLKFARDTGCLSFVYASSMAVYGDPAQLPVAEDAPLRPNSFYGVGKLASEHYLRLYAGMGINCVALRLNNVYGIGQDLSNHDQGMVSIYLGKALNERRIVVKGSLDRFRDFVHVDDVVEAFIRASNSPGQVGFVAYNVATGRGTTVRDLIDMLARALPFAVSVEVSDGTAGDQFGIYCSPAAIAEGLGWRPSISVEDGIPDLVRAVAA
jgi:UDP-glucose 4-epimerase